MENIFDEPMLVYPVLDCGDFEQLYLNEQIAQAWCDEANARIEAATQYYLSDAMDDTDECWEKFYGLGGMDYGNKYFVGSPMEVY